MYQVDVVVVGCWEGNYVSWKLVVLGFVFLQEGGDVFVVVSVVQGFDKVVLFGFEVIVQ